MLTRLAESFAHFKMAGKNPRWSWSARSADGKEVAITLWKDYFDYSVSPTMYHLRISPSDVAGGVDALGNKERLENLIWAEDNCNGEFRVVITVAVDINAKKRKIKKSYPKDGMIGRIIKLDRETGEFEAVILDREELNA